METAATAARWWGDATVILLLGNCQLQRMSYIFRINGIECRYLANTERVDSGYNVDKVLQATTDASLVIAQPIFNESSPLHYKVIFDRAAEVIFVPYLYIDGLFSLEATDVGSSTILGSEALSPFLDKSYDEMLGSFHTGQIDFRCRDRLTASLTELQRREAEVEVDAIIISDIIAEYWREWPLVISHNHPGKWLMNLVAERLFRKIGRPYRPYDELPHYHRVEYLFNAGESVLSPYDADELGLKYEPDDQWWMVGNRLLRRYWDTHRQG